MAGCPEWSEAEPERGTVVNSFGDAVADISRTGFRLIGEGIETEEEAATLAELGVEYGLGYLFGHPEPATGQNRGE